MSTFSLFHLLMIKVARYIYGKPEPRIDDYTSIPAISRSRTKWRFLSPFFLKDKEGHIFENVYQFSKCYAAVPNMQIKNPITGDIVFSHGSEVHYDKNKILDDYYIWRKKGIECSDPIRFPVGKNNSHKCLFSLANNDDGTVDIDNKLDYVSSRKKIYINNYAKLVMETPEYQELEKLYKNGKNILILDVDGPHEESLEYYKGKYGVDDNFIVNNTVEVNEKNVNILLNDTKHPFGHGMALAMTLMGKQQEWCN